MSEIIIIANQSWRVFRLCNSSFIENFLGSLGNTVTTNMFYGHNAGQSVLAGSLALVKSWRILLERMPLLTVAHSD